MKPLFGEKVVLFPFTSKDFGYLEELMNNGNRARMFEFLAVDDFLGRLYNGMLEGQFKVWVSKTMRGKASSPVGMVILVNINDHLRGIKLIPDGKFLKGLTKFLKTKKNSYIEDTLKTVLKEDDAVRLEIKIPTRDVLMSTLIQKNGFKREGTLKKYALVDDELLDVSIYAKIKEMEN